MAFTNRKKIILFGVIVFIFMFVFFTQIQLLVPYNTDDWAGLSGARYAIPTLKSFNPTRILPEVAMPICSYIATYFVMPFQHSVIDSLSLVAAIMLCMIIVIYVLSLTYYLQKKLSLSTNQSIMITLFFIVFHFLIFCSNQSDNNFLLYSNSLTNYFFYLMPAMLNMALLLYFSVRQTNNRFILAILLLIVYLSICSNLFCSYILAMGVGTILLYSLIKEKGDIREKLKNIILKKVDYMLILILWLITAIYEVNGGRSMSIQSNSLSQNIKETINCLKSIPCTINKYFIFFAIVCFLISMFVLIANGLREKKSQQFIETNIKLILLIVIYSSFIIILCAKTYPSYITRPDVLFGPMAIMLILICTWIGFIISSYPNSIIISILTLFILLNFTNTTGRTFKDINGMPGKICRDIDNDIIQQHVDADKRGETYIEIHVPKSGYEDNWPLALYGSNRIGNFLYKYGLISHEIEVLFIPDEEINRKYGID